MANRDIFLIFENVIRKIKEASKFEYRIYKVIFKFYNYFIRRIYS